jgi:NADH:ubiquinone oxidoreductase subunit D
MMDGGERNQEDWRQKMRDALLRKREQVSRLRDSIAHDQENITRWRIKIGFLRPGGRSADIHYDLELRIADVEDRIRSKQRKIGELEAAISDIESKL